MLPPLLKSLSTCKHNESQSSCVLQKHYSKQDTDVLDFGVTNMLRKYEVLKIR